MRTKTAREELVQQLSYALAVQTLVEQKAISDPQANLSQKWSETTKNAAEHLITQFERLSLLDEIRRIKSDRNYLYGLSQGIIAAFIYSVLLIIFAYILKLEGVDLLTVLLRL